jgi:hypothetical protein
MILLETIHFRKHREKIVEAGEKESLRSAVLSVLKDPPGGKSLKVEFPDLKSLRFIDRGQARRLIYKFETGRITLVSFGPRGGID